MMDKRGKSPSLRDFRYLMHFESMCVENGRSEQEKLEDLATMTENTLKALYWVSLLILMVG